MSTDTPEARLEALGGMAAEVDAANPTAEQQQAQEQEVREGEQVDEAARQWGFIPFTIGGTLAILAPELRAIYTEDACYQWGKAAAAVSKKYGWDSPSAMPELALAAASLHFVVPSVLIVRAKLQEMKEGKATGLAAKLGVWWRARKAAKAAKEQGGEAPAAQGAPA
jgi:hypothetical protein